MTISVMKIIIVFSENHRILAKLSRGRQGKPKTCQIRRTVGQAGAPGTGMYLLIIAVIA